MVRHEIENKLTRTALAALCAGAIALFGRLPATAASLAAATDAPSPEPPVSFGAGTSIVRLDVVVRDKHGRAERNLTAKDFEVFEDGAAQVLDSFRIFSKEAPGGAPAAGPETPTTAGSAVPSSEEPSVVAFVFDRMSPEARSLSRQAALEHVDAGQVRGCVVGVFSIDLALHLMEPFTTDPARVRAGLERAGSGVSAAFSQDTSDTRRRIDEVVRSSESLQHMGEGQQSPNMAGPAAMLAVKNLLDMMEIHVQRASEALENDQQGFATMNGLMGVVEVLERVPGRKAIVLLSEGLKLPANVLGRFRSVVAAANRAQVSIYTLDTGGLRATSPLDESLQEQSQLSRLQMEDATNDVRLANGPMTRLLERNEELLRLDPHTGLGQLAEETGGLSFHDSNDAFAGFERVGEDLRFHYLLSYSPTNQKLDGRFRRISVRVRKPRLEVQTRKGYLALPASAPKPVVGPEAQALAQLDSLPQPSALAVRAIALSFPEPRRPGLVPVLVEVPQDALSYAPTADGGRRADVTIAVRIKNEHEHEVARLSDRYLIPPASANAPGRPLQFYREVDLAPGRYTVESVAYDATSRAAGVRTWPLEVPAVGEHELRLSSLVLASGAEPAPTTGTEGRNPLQFGGVFLQPNLGQPLHKSSSPMVGFFFTAYGDPNQPASREASIELRRGDETLSSARTELPSLDADGRVQHAGTLSLEALEPGPYTLAVTVTDGRRSDTRRAAFMLER